MAFYLLAGDTRLARSLIKEGRLLKLLLEGCPKL